MAEDLKRLYKRRFEEELEPERYEIFDLLQDLTPDRREFLTSLGGGLFFLVTVRAQGPQSQDVPVRVQISDDGTYRAFTGKMEMGQGSRTLLTQAFAEELGVDVDKVQLVMGDTLLCPDDGGTWSSLTSPQTMPVIRQAAAAVRAARAGGTDALTGPANWRTLGASVPNVDSRAIVTGGKTYPTDVSTPGMLHAAIVRSPHHRATLTSYDAGAAEKIPGVRVLRDADLLAVVAADRAIGATRGQPRDGGVDARAAHVGRRLAVIVQEDGRRAGGAAACAVPGAPRARRRDHGPRRWPRSERSSSYWLSPIAHVPLEPRAAVAEWKDERGHDSRWRSGAVHGAPGGGAGPEGVRIRRCAS